MTEATTMALMVPHGPQLAAFAARIGDEKCAVDSAPIAAASKVQSRHWHCTGE
jgi:hypothetical protein